jgi:hypothetical protein
MTAVTGHLTNVEFTSEYKNWSHPPPESLFAAPIVTNVHDVGDNDLLGQDAVADYLTGQERHCQEHSRSSQICAAAGDMDRL